MIAVETNIGSLKVSNTPPVLEIRFEFVDGSSESFIQNDTKTAKAILQRINPSYQFHHLFSQTRIVVADDYSKSVFVCSQINRVDFLFKGSGFSHIPSDHAELVELTEARFRKYVPLNSPSRLEKRAQRRQVGDTLVSFNKLRMRGGRPVYLMKETLVKLPAESQSYMQRFLSRGALGIRLPCGGESILNLANLIGYTVYPGVTEIPADSWMAEPKGFND